MVILPESIGSMNEPSNRGGDVALFIDWENFKISLAAGHMYPNVSALKEEASNHGRVVVAKAYADWVTRSPELRGASQFINDPPALYAAGIEPVYVPTRLSYGSPSASGYTRTTRVKNSVDIKMTTDCIETAHAYPNIVSFILVSGDSDFIHVINTLRTMGKHVVIVGVSWSTSRRLADQVDGLILYDVDVDPETPPEPPPPTRTLPRPDTATSTGAEPSAVPELPEIIRAIEDIVREERRAGGAPLLTSIKQRLTRRFTSFDERKLGFSGFKKLMARVAQEGQIKLITEGLVDWAIMADEPDPDGSTQRRPANGHRAPTALEPSSTTETLDAAESDTEEPEPDLEAVLLVKQPDDAEPASDFTLEETQDSTAGDIYEPTPDDTSPESAPSLSEPSAPPRSPELASLMESVMAELKDLPKQPEDGHTGDRIVDLIIMANTLEQREDVSHVAFNFLVGEVCQALEQGIEAENPYIQSRWGKAASRTYVSRLLRSMGNGDLFTKSWHSVPDEASGRNKRRRTFYLDQENPLVKITLQEHGQVAVAEPSEEDELPMVSVAEPSEQDELPMVSVAEPSEQDELPMVSVAESSEEDELPVVSVAEPSEEDELAMVSVAEPSEEDELAMVSVAEPSEEDELPVVSVADSSENSGDAPEAEPPAGGTDAPFLLRLFRPNR